MLAEFLIWWISAIIMFALGVVTGLLIPRGDD